MCVVVTISDYIKITTVTHLHAFPKKNFPQLSLSVFCTKLHHEQGTVPNEFLQEKIKIKIKKNKEQERALFSKGTKREKEKPIYALETHIMKQFQNPPNAL